MPLESYGCRTHGTPRFEVDFTDNNRPLEVQELIICSCLQIIEEGAVATLSQHSHSLRRRRLLDLPLVSVLSGHLQA